MMLHLRAFVAQVQGLFAQKKANGEFDAELQEHLRLLTERFVRQGMSAQDAAGAARRQFGNIALLQQRQRETRTLLSLAIFLARHLLRRAAVVEEPRVYRCGGFDSGTRHRRQHCDLFDCEWRAAESAAVSAP
jgi:hypothetical protein